MDNIEKSFSTILRHSWVSLLLRGIVAIAFGILIFIWPKISLEVLVLLFGFYAVIDGILAIWIGFGGRKLDRDWWVFLVGGLFGIAIGVLTFWMPGITALALLFYIAIWAIATGILEIVAAVRLRREISGEWWAILGGIASIAFGVLLTLYPSAGALAVLWLIGFYALIFGILLVVLAFKAQHFASIVTK